MHEPKYQNGQKILKWNQHAKIGQFLGFSHGHSSLVANARNLRAGYIGPHFHVVFDDLFEMVSNSGEHIMMIDAICNHLLKSNWDLYTGDEFSTEGE